jgi:hypothetical protein
MLNQFIKSMIMKMKATKFSLFGLLALFLVFTACEDDFSEQDLLELQAELAETKAQNDFDRELLKLAAMAEDAQELEVLKDQLSRATDEYLDILADALDDEDDSLEAAAAMEILRVAGFIVQYDVEVVSNDAGIEDVAVSLTTAGGVMTSDSTDANGIASFVDVPVGFGDVSVDGSGYLPIAYTIDFGTPDVNIINIYVNGQWTSLNTPNTGRSTVQMIASDAITGAATVSGYASGHLDLTSDEEDLLEGVVVTASLNTVNGFGTGNADAQLVETDASWDTGDPTGEVKFDVEGFSMVDTTDGSGTYSIMVPASEDVSFNYEISFSEEISADQYVAAVSSSTDSVEVVAVDAFWGIDADDNSGNIPDVYGYEVVISESASGLGSGFDISITDTVSRSIDFDNLNSFIGDGATEGDRNTISTGGSSGWATGIVTWEEEGSYPFATPTATVNGGDGSAAAYFERTYEMDDADDFTVEVTTDGSGGYYNASVTVGTLYLQLIGTVNGTSDSDTIIFELGDVDSDASGDVTSTSFTGQDGNDWTAVNYYISEDTPSDEDVTFNDGDSDEVNFSQQGGTYDLTTDQSFEEDFGMRITSSSFSLIFAEDDTEVADDTQTNATISYSAGTWDIYDIQFHDDSNGSSYKQAPTSVTGSNNFQLTFNMYAFQYDFELDNSSASGYDVVPDEITVSGTAWSDEVTSGTRSSGSITARNSQGTVETNDFYDLLTVTNDTLTPYNTTVTEFRVNEYFSSVPSLDAIEDNSEDHEIEVNSFNSEDGIDGLSVSEGSWYNTTFSFEVIGRAIAANAAGNGLDLTPTTQASFSIDNTAFETDAQTKMVSWDESYNIDVEGAGYVEEVNYTSNDALKINGTADADAKTTVTATVNGEIEVNISYGTGDWVDEDLVLLGDN